MKLRLTVRYPSGQTAPFEVTKPAATVGRAPECDLCVADTAPAASWEHVRFEITPHGAFVTDMGSSNGTYVNNGRIAVRTLLSVGDEVRMSVTGPFFHVEAIDTAPAPPPPLPKPAPSAPVWLPEEPAPVGRLEPPAPTRRPPPVPPSPPRPRPEPEREPEPVSAGRKVWPLFAIGAGAFALSALLVVGLFVYQAHAAQKKLAADQERALVEEQRARVEVELAEKKVALEKARVERVRAETAQAKADEEERVRTAEAVAKKKERDEIAKKEREEAEEEEKKRIAALPPPLTNEEKAQWQSASLVLSNPAGMCVGVTVDLKAEPPVVKLCAKNDANPNPGPLHQAWDHMIPAITQDRLTVKLFKYKVGDTLDATDAADVMSRLRPTPLVPSGKEIVAFEVVRGGVKRNYVGYLMAEDKNKTWTVCGLVPRPVAPGVKSPFQFETETIPLREMVATTVRRGLNRSEVQLRADFLDYALNEALQKLEATPRDPSGLPIRPCLFIHPTVVHPDLVNEHTERLRTAMADTEEARMESTKETMRLINQGRMAGGRGFWMAVATLSDSMARLRATNHLNRDLQAQYEARYQRHKADREHLLNMHDASRLLDMELRTKLVSAGVHMVDGSEEAMNSYVQAGGTLARPKADAAVSDGLVTATHVLIPEIQRANSTGEYHLAIRLVNQQTPNKIDMASDGDRALRTTGRSGIYRNDREKLVLRLTETGPEVRLSLWYGQSPKMTKFELTGTRDRDNKVVVTSCTIALKGDPRSRYEYHTDAKLELLGDGQIKVLARGATLREKDYTGKWVLTTRPHSHFTETVLTKDGP